MPSILEYMQFATGVYAASDKNKIDDPAGWTRNAWQLNPARWSGDTRNWTHIGAVTLNPERDSIIKTHLDRHDTQPLAA